MSFDATASELLIPASEEQEMPDCLPMVSFFTGFERATNMLKTSSGITVEFQHLQGQQPTVTLVDVPDLLGIHTYHAAQFLNCAATNDTFAIGATWNDQRDVVLPASDVQAIAAFISEQVDASTGRFVIQWVATNPADPF